MGRMRRKVCTDEVRELIKDGRKKFVRLDEGAILYSMGKSTFRQLAVDANAMYHIKKITLVNTQIIDDYLETYPGVKTYMDNTIKQAHLNGYVRTMFNRKRNIPELQNTNYMIRQSGERIALNTPIQGTAADILKKAMVEIYNELNRRSLKSKMLIQVHDELVFNVYEDELEEVRSIVKNIMENTFKMSVPLKVEMEVGENWYEAK